MLVAVYCSGSIPKGSLDEGRLCWTDRERAAVAHGASPLDVQFLNPDDPVSDLSDNLSLFGRDMLQVKMADVVIVDARERRGIGVGVEMAASRLLGTPLIAVVPDNSHYKLDSLSYRGSTVENYTHPHFATLCDIIVPDFESAGRWIHDACSNGGLLAKGATIIDNAITTYRERLLPSDEPMQRIVELVRHRSS
jgi:hypothetical protein